MSESTKIKTIITCFLFIVQSLKPKPVKDRTGQDSYSNWID